MELLTVPVATGSSGSGSVPLWVTVLVGVAGAIATTFVALSGAIARERARRRENHAAAMRALLGWHELPYQIRRRVNDSDTEIARLRDLAHALQQDISYSQALLASESRHLGEAYARATAGVKRATGEHIKDAWRNPPGGGPEGQVLDEWGPGSPNGDLQCLFDELPWRFGWRRLVPRRIRW